MCRLFGFRSAVLSRAHRSLVVAENALAIQAREHRDGWGIAFFHGAEPYLIKREAAAADCENFRRASARLASNTLVVHVRKATVGAVSPQNVHPFRHGRWVFAHNGTIHGFEAVRPRLLAETPAVLADRICGSTDTETVFHWLLARLGAAGLDPTGVTPVAPESLADTLAQATARLCAHSRAAGVPLPVFNFLLTNGVVFAAQRHGRELHFATQKVRCADADTCPWPDRICLEPTRPGGRVNHLLVASERIGEEDRWEEVPEGSLLTLGPDWVLRRRALAA